MSYQTEERYWTDYVRVATPIIGLLLLLGVFWYWASSLIGADSEEPPATEIAAVTVVAAPTSTPTPTEEVELSAETAEPTATETASEPSPTSEPEVKPTRTPRQQAEEPTEVVEAGSFAEGEVILSKDDGVNMRSQPSTDAEVIEVLSLDQPVTVVDGQPQEGGGFVWWNVRNEESGNEGWVVEEWLKKQE